MDLSTKRILNFEVTYMSHLRYGGQELDLSTRCVQNFEVTYMSHLSYVKIGHLCLKHVEWDHDVYVTFTL